MAGTALALGLLVYVLDRPSDTAALWPWSGFRPGAPLFGAAGGSLPSFAHAFAFALLTAATAPRSLAPPYWSCMLWWAIDTGFEAAQAPTWKPILVDGTQRWLGDGWLPSLFTRYVERGTFDWIDLAAATAGTLAAAVALAIMWQRKDRHEEPV
jgi:hypothetical protein